MLRVVEAARKRYPGFLPQVFSVVIPCTHRETDQRTLTIKRIFGFITGLLLLTVIALLIHGYHPYAEDAEIYLPGVLKILNPNLFPANAEFFREHAGHTLYPNLIAYSVRATHLPLPWAAFLWHLVSIFLLLAASWRLASALFQPESSESESLEDKWARWAAVALMAALLTLPIAGTALYILDQYLNPRNLAAFAAVFAVAEVLHRKHGRAVLWLGFAAVVPPLMAGFPIGFFRSEGAGSGGGRGGVCGGGGPASKTRARRVVAGICRGRASANGELRYRFLRVAQLAPPIPPASSGFCGYAGLWPHSRSAPRCPSR